MKKLIIFIPLLIALFYGCETTTSSNNEASLLTINQLNTTPGYEWYDVYFNKYKPDPTIIAQISKNYQNNKFNIYVNPSCACSGTQFLFPSLMKCLISAGIPESNISIYSMIDAGYKHNMMDKYSVKILPSCFINKNGNYYSIIDSLNKYQVLNPTDTLNLVEKAILNSLK